MLRRRRMKFRARLVIGLTAILASVFVNGGCGKTSEIGEVVIPAVVDETGPIAMYGNWAIEGMTLAIEKINSQGGIDGRKVRLLIEDGQSNPRAGVSAFQKILSTQKPPTIIVATNTSTVMACAPLANKNEVVLFAPISSGANVTEAGDFVFRNRVSGYYEAREMAAIASEKLGLKKVALVVINNDAGPGYVESFSERFRSNDGTITETILLDPEKGDYRTDVLKVKSSSPESVFLALTVKEAATFIKQSVEIDFRPKWLSMTTIQSDELFKIAGEAAEGLVFVAEGGNEDDSQYQEFASHYKERYGSKPPMNALNGYDAIRLLAPKLAGRGVSGISVRDFLYGIKNFRGVGGVLSFDSNGDAKKPLLLMKVQGGKFVSAD